MNLQSRTIVRTVALLLLAGFVLVSYLIYTEGRGKLVSDAPRAIRQPITSSEGPESCGNRFCDAGEKQSCPWDCRSLIDQPDGTASINLGEKYSSIRQSFLSVGENPKLSSLQLTIFNTLSAPISLKIHREGSFTSPIYEQMINEEGVLGDYFIQIELEEKGVVLISGERYIIELNPTDGVDTSFSRSPNANSYRDGDLSAFGPLYADDGGLIDPNEEWRKIEGDLHFALYLTTDGEQFIVIPE